jgi:hypothetical protein
MVYTRVKGCCCALKLLFNLTGCFPEDNMRAKSEGKYLPTMIEVTQRRTESKLCGAIPTWREST